MANVAAIVIQRGDDAESKQPFGNGVGAGGPHATVHKPRHAQRYIQHVLDIVVVGVALVVAGVSPPVEGAQIHERPGEGRGRVALV
jgi:hypothetical protein